MTDSYAKLELLLETPGITEGSIHELFESNSELLPLPDLLNHDLHFNCVFTQFEIDRDKIADFAFITKSSGEWRVVFVELERPQKELFVSTPYFDFHSDTRRAIAQVESWRTMTKARPEEVRRKFRHLIMLGRDWDTNPVEFRFLLIIGRNKSGRFPAEAAGRVSRLGSESDIRLITYDTILRAKAAWRLGSRKNILAHHRGGFRIKSAQADTNLFAHYHKDQIEVADAELQWFRDRGYDMDAWLKGELLTVNGKMPMSRSREVFAGKVT